MDRAAAFAILGRLDASLMDATRAIELVPEGVDVLVSAYSLQAAVLADPDRVREAIGDPRSALELLLADHDLCRPVTEPLADLQSH